MSQPTAPRQSRKKTLISLLVLLALTGVIVFIFKDHWTEITSALQRLSLDALQHEQPHAQQQKQPQKDGHA